MKETEPLLDLCLCGGAMGLRLYIATQHTTLLFHSSPNASSKLPCRVGGRRSMAISCRSARTGDRPSYTHLSDLYAGCVVQMHFRVLCWPHGNAYLASIRRCKGVVANVAVQHLAMCAAFVFWKAECIYTISTPDVELLHAQALLQQGHDDAVDNELLNPC